MTRKSSKVLRIIPAVILLVLAGFVWLPRLFGCSVYFVKTDSMKPTIPKGSMAYVVPIALKDIKAAEDVLVFNDIDHKKSFMHRCVAVNAKAGLIYTKGDNNDADDPLPTEYSNCIGKVKSHIPFLGYAAMALNTFAGKMAVVLFYAVCLALLLEKGRAAKAKKREVEA